MIKFEENILSNGLKVIVNQDKNTPLAAFNLLYDVGARDEHENRTGFAHLFEHLMFSGSKNVTQFDEVVQLAGGTNNAFTSNDITNYYISLPAINIETAFFVDSDRMNALSVTSKNIDIQKGVVVEEFNQRYLNQPYGDAMLYLRPLAYKSHPYQWATIGKNTKHIEEASHDDVISFYNKHYNPNRAILSISGNVNPDHMFDLAQKWFGSIKNKGEYVRNLVSEPNQASYRNLTVERNVPFDAIYMAFPMCKRTDDDYYVADLVSDILSRGDSSRFYQQLIRNYQLFSSINAYVTGSFDEGMMIISGKLSENGNIEKAEKAIFNELNELFNVTERELTKVKNKAISSNKFGEVSILNRAMNLSYFSLLGNTNFINQQDDFYSNVSLADLKRVSSEIFNKNRANVLYYKSTKN